MARAGRQNRRSVYRAAFRIYKRQGIFRSVLRDLRVKLVRDSVAYFGSERKAAKALGVSLRTVQRYMKGA